MHVFCFGCHPALVRQPRFLINIVLCVIFGYSICDTISWIIIHWSTNIVAAVIGVADRISWLSQVMVLLRVNYARALECDHLGTHFRQTFNSRASGKHMVYLSRRMKSRSTSCIVGLANKAYCGRAISSSSLNMLVKSATLTPHLRMVIRDIVGVRNTQHLSWRRLISDEIELNYGERLLYSHPM